MTTDRFNELLNGPLAHPVASFCITGLARALLYVVMATGEAGDRALEDYCRQDDHDEEEVDE